jgi:small subunit ribosomal protein S16
MAVKLRLARAGAKKAPFYRIVATDSRSPRDGRFIEQLGIYDPTRTPVEVRLERERIEHWLKVGATASDTVSEILERYDAAAPAAPAPVPAPTKGKKKAA